MKFHFVAQQQATCRLHTLRVYIFRTMYAYKVSAILTALNTRRRSQNVVFSRRGQGKNQTHVRPCLLFHISKMLDAQKVN